MTVFGQGKKKFLQSRYMEVSPPLQGNERSYCQLPNSPNYRGDVFEIYAGWERRTITDKVRENEHTQFCYDLGGKVIKEEEGKKVLKNSRDIGAVCCHRDGHTAWVFLPFSRVPSIWATFNASDPKIKGQKTFYREDVCAGGKLADSQECYKAGSPIFNPLSNEKGELGKESPSSMMTNREYLKSKLKAYSEALSCGANSHGSSARSDNKGDNKHKIQENAVRESRWYCPWCYGNKEDSLASKYMDAKKNLSEVPANSIEGMKKEVQLPVCCKTGDKTEVLGSECSCKASYTYPRTDDHGKRVYLPEVVPPSHCGDLQKAYDNLSKKLTVRLTPEGAKKELDEKLKLKRYDSCTPANPSQPFKASCGDESTLYDLNCTYKVGDTRKTHELKVICHGVKLTEDTTIDGASNVIKALIPETDKGHDNICHLVEGA